MKILIKKILGEGYLFARRIFGGYGLSRCSLLRNLNVRFERFLRGPRQESFIYMGFRFYLDPRNDLKPNVLRPWKEPESQPIHRLMSTMLKDGDVFVDVGACIGWYTVFASKSVGYKGKVYAFEPNPTAFELLKKNTTENHCENVIVENVAVSEKNGWATLYTVGDLLYGSTLFDPKKNPNTFIVPHLADDEDKTVHEYKVRTASLDSYFANKKIDFIKIDTEGSEGKILKGMVKMLTANPDVIIVAEFSPTLLENNDTDPDTYLGFVHKLGLSIFVLDYRGLAPLNNTPKAGVDLLFTKRRLEKLNFS